jgi:hypothetical protein
MAIETVVHLNPSQFGERERQLVAHGSLSASTFTYDSGVRALRLRNELGEAVTLPFQGQQIWSLQFLGRELTMKSMFDGPRLTQDYLNNYGGFLLHCGLTAMGVPTAEDSHPLHGELPNAPYQQAWVVAGEDERGAYLSLGGQYRHTVAFNHNYVARPLLTMRAGSSLLEMAFEMTNLKHTEMELMYLAHINFRPITGARLLYTAQADPEHVRVRRSIPSHVHTKPGYREFLDELQRNPALHHVLTPDLNFDPEAVLTIDYMADQDGWAHTMQLHPDGNADYVSHRPQQLNKGVRWICRTPDQDAIGIVLPATAEPEGYSAEKAKGNVKAVPAGGSWQAQFKMGALTGEQAAKMQTSIGKVTGNRD